MKKISELEIFTPIQATSYIQIHSTVIDALELLKNTNCGALPVTDGSQIVGILSERDCVRKVDLLGRTSNKTLVSEIMSRPIVIVDIESTVEECANIMLSRGIRHLLVTESTRVHGILSIKDILRAVINEPSILKTKEFELNQTALESLQDPSDNAQLENESSVLLALSNAKETQLVRLALGTSVSQLDSVYDFNNAEKLLTEKHYDIVCVSQDLIQVALCAFVKNPKVSTVLLTSEDELNYFQIVKDHPFITHILSHANTDPEFVIRNIHVAIKKISQKNYFGLEKYLNWGTPLKQFNVDPLQNRELLLQEISTHFKELGLRKTLIDRIGNVTEELLMNAIYDAPVDHLGKPRYNHFPRNKKISIGCDGSILGISVTDPFGSLSRDTIIHYLETRINGHEPLTNENKGGGGHGLYIVFRLANTTIFNIKKGQATEVIALFDVVPKEHLSKKKPAFQFFAA